jgi:hypothetical protein
LAAYRDCSYPTRPVSIPLDWLTAAFARERVRGAARALAEIGGVFKDWRGQSVAPRAVRPLPGGGQAALRRWYFRACFSRTLSGCNRAYLRSLQRLEQTTRSRRPSKPSPHSTHLSFVGGIRRRSFCPGCARRHCRLASAQHARHQELQPLLSLRFGRNAENGRTSLHLVQRRPAGRCQYAGGTHEKTPTGSPTCTSSSSDTRSFTAYEYLSRRVARVKRRLEICV